MLIRNLYNGVFFSFLSFSMFAFMDVTNKFIFSKQYLPFFSYALLLDIGIISFLILIILFWFKFSLSMFKTKNAWALLGRSILSVANTLFSLLAISYLPLHIFYALVFTQPMISSICSIIFRIEKMNLTKILFIILGFIGVIITIELWQGTDKTPILGIIGGLGIAFTGALSGLIVKRFMTNDSPITIAFYNILLSIIIISLYLAYTKTSLVLPSTIHVSVLIVCASLLACMGMIFFMKSYQIGTVQNVVGMQYTQIIWGILFGYLIFDSKPTLASIVGCIIIVVSNYLILITNSASKST